MKLRPLATVLLIALLSPACRKPAPTAAEFIRRGDELFQSKQYREATQAYRAAVQANSRDGATRLKLANTYVLAGDLDNAAAESVRAADLLPTNEEAQLLAISLMLPQERWVDVLDRVSVRLERDPDNPQLNVLYGSAKARMVSSWAFIQQFDEAFRSGRTYEAVQSLLRTRRPPDDDRLAEAAFRRALKAKPDMTEAEMALANLLWATGRMDEGDVLLKRVADRNPSDVLMNRALGVYDMARHRDVDAEHYLKIAASSHDVDSEMAVVDFYVGVGRDQDALATLRDMAAGNDPQGVASLRAADIELRLGQSEQARQRAETILARDPKNPHALLIKGQLLFAASQRDEALKLARTSVAMGPSSGPARVLLARCLAATGDPEAAYREYGEAIRLNPGDWQASRELAEVALGLGRDGVALSLARQSADLKPGDTAVSITLAKALIRGRDFSAANKVLGPLVARTAAPADALVLLGAIQAARGNRDAASATYLRALDVDRNSIDALSGLVTIDLSDRQVAQARARVDQALSAHPNAAPYQLLSARVSLAAGDTARTESTLRAVLASAPADVAAARMLADVLASNGHLEDAKRVIEDALVQRPASQELSVSLAGLLEAMGRMAEAQTRYESVLAANPEVYAVSSKLAALYTTQGGNLDVALGLATTAKQHLPDDPRVSDTLGWVYVQKGFPSTGLPHLQDAARAEPRTAMFRYHLGMAYQHMGQRVKARDELTQAVKLGQTFPGLADAKSTLSTLAK